jgi:outer membrane receptor protein involved in Fe transport
MKRQNWIRAMLLGGACALALASAQADDFDIPAGDLKSALGAYMAETGVQLMVSESALRGAHTSGVKGSLTRDEALIRLLKGTGFSLHRDESGAIGIVRTPQAANQPIPDFPVQFAQATPAPRASVETVTVTSSKLGSADVQSIPISITALSQEQLTATQTAGGPDLVKQVPNLTFTKTNFTGYSIQIRGIGTQAISVTTDPAVAVAFNDQPFIRNHFFEQEFYDVAQVEVLRGPQGTLYGRNATAGVVNLTSAKPTDQFEATASAELGNYHQRRFEGMVNLPIVDDRLDIRLAGEWTKRQGYSFNALTDSRIDGRDLWSGRLTIGLKPLPNLQTYFIWEHFSEDDDRMRTSKQLCKTDPGLNHVGSLAIKSAGDAATGAVEQAYTVNAASFSQGCLPTSLYSSEAFEVPNGFSLPYYTAGLLAGVVSPGLDPYASVRQSRNLRVIESSINPIYRAKNDTVEFNADYQVSPVLTFSSQTGFNNDFLWSTEDYNRFNTSSDIFVPLGGSGSGHTMVDANGVMCDPQLGCQTRLVAQDLSTEHAWQLSQEFRFASRFSGPLNFSVGGNYMHYETAENYYVFINSLTAEAATSAAILFQQPWIAGVTDDHECLRKGNNEGGSQGYQDNDPFKGAGTPTTVCNYIDPNSITNVNDEGHNYFLSQNPYLLDSYAAFGEIYYNILDDLKITGGFRWTKDRKHFTDIPSEVLSQGYGYASTGVVNQVWDQFTGRAAVNWTPDLDFTDQTLLYGSYAHGYKAGGANPPGAVLADLGGGSSIPIHPLTFKPEFVDAFELGTKNTLLDGALTINGSLFYYNYENYQISEIVDRTSINLNFDAHVKGAELEASWEPVPGVRFNFAGGWEDTALAKGSSAVDLIDRVAGHPGWVVMKPFVTQSSNCIFPVYLIEALVPSYRSQSQGNSATSACGYAYLEHVDPITGLPYDPENPRLTNKDVLDRTGNVATGAGSIPGSDIPLDYPGFDPYSAPNNGAGFSKDLSGNELPNAPPFTISAGAQYTMPLSSDWAGTLRADYYWQDYSWGRVLNDNPYDRIRGYTNVNLTLILTSQNGWQLMLYDKNVFNTTAITGTFLNTDDSGLTTNVFLTDPKLIGIRDTKNW